MSQIEYPILVPPQAEELPISGDAMSEARLPNTPDALPETWTPAQYERVALMAGNNAIRGAVLRKAEMMGATDPEAVLQETLMRLASPSAEDIRDPIAWAITVASRIVFSQKRLLSSKREFLVSDPRDFSGGTTAFEDRIVLRTILDQILGRLSSRDQTLLHLLYFRDLSVAQTAAEMNVSEGAVKSRHHHALKRAWTLAQKLNIS